MKNKQEILFDCARQLFATKGYRDTAVADITGLAGFAVGTFYRYYPSKDKLFFEILTAETTAMMKGILLTLNMDDDPVTLIKQLLTRNMEGMLSNPILVQWYQPDVYDKIETVFRQENGLDAMTFLYHDFFVLVQKWQSEGKMRTDISCEMIMAIFSAILHLGYHKEEIGLDYFPALQDHLTDFVLQGLTNVPKMP